MKAARTPKAAHHDSHDDAYWAAKLPRQVYDVMRSKATEAPYSGKLLHNKETGEYACAACGQPLFGSDAKFDSCGWPSFSEAIHGSVVFSDDRSFRMERVEVSCSKCGGHLGHVFDDGPGPNGKRFCINSLALGFRKA